MQITSLLWLSAALGGVTTALPSAHAHNHRAAHAALAERGHPVFWKPNHHKPTKATTSAPTTAAAPPPATTPPAQSAPTPTTAAAQPPPASNPSAGQYRPFCGGKKMKRATDAQIAYKGNTGLVGHWGCNIMTIDASIADQYQYTTVYTNRASEPYQVVCTNKIGPTGLINGFFGFSAVTFQLAPGQSQTVAFDSNSQGGCYFHSNSIPKTMWGEWAGSWVEFDFGNESNGGHSGADCSSLVAQSAGMDVPGCRVCASGECSTIWPGGRGDNAYIQGTEAVDGLGLNLVPGNVRLQVDVGFSG